MLHQTELIHADVDDPATLAFWTDLQKLMTHLYQSMPILGPWMEARVKEMMRDWIPSDWCLSGPSQIIDPNRPEFRSRSWDIVVHRPFSEPEYPPPASLESGYPLIPIDCVAAVIDTKTTFNDPRAYADQTVFDLMNQATEQQLEFLGHDITKIILAAASVRSAEALNKAGGALGLQVFSMARVSTGPVSDGPDRLTTWTLQRFADGSTPLCRFRDSVRAMLEERVLSGK